MKNLITLSIGFLLAVISTAGFSSENMQEKSIKYAEQVCKTSTDPVIRKRACEQVQNFKAANMFLSSVKTDTKSN